MTRFQAASARIGELHLGDFIAYASDAETISVVALDSTGSPRLLEVRLTRKWGGGWQVAMACPLCSLPARVLMIDVDVVACGRCMRRPTLQATRKNQTRWREDALADLLARNLLNGRDDKYQARQTARTLGRRALARAESSLVLAARAIGAANRALRE